MPQIKNGLVLPDILKSSIHRLVDPWTCETCKRVFQEKAEVYIEYDGKLFCCSKCFRICERKKHAQELSK